MRYVVIFVLVCFGQFGAVMAGYDTLLIDDRSSGSRTATSGGEWRLITDRVMGGMSDGRLTGDETQGKSCLRLRGKVALENNEQYNVHIRTPDNSLPWQSYRGGFLAAPEWKRLRIPFPSFEPYRTNKDLDIGGIERIGIVAIGRAFSADLCIGGLGFFK